MEKYKNENAVVDAAWKQILERYPGSYLIKINGGMYQESGIPDVLHCIDGLFVGIEYKHWKPSESFEVMLSRVTLKQRRHIARIVHAGGMAGVAWDPETALNLVKLAKLKAKMIARGDDPKNYPLPPHWDTLVKVPASQVVNVDEIEINPTPLKEEK